MRNKTPAYTLGRKPLWGLVKSSDTSTVPGTAAELELAPGVDVALAAEAVDALGPATDNIYG